MEFRHLIEIRYSVRAYRPDSVPDPLLRSVLEAARLAPTAANRQPFRLIVLHTEGRKEELGTIYARDWFVQAPLVIAVVGVPGEAWVRRDGVSYLQADATIALDHLILAAAEAGLGTCWIANFETQAARKVLELPPEVEPIYFTPLGYPADPASTKRRRSLDELVRFEKW